MDARSDSEKTRRARMVSSDASIARRAALIAQEQILTRLLIAFTDQTLRAKHTKPLEKSHWLELLTKTHTDGHVALRRIRYGSFFEANLRNGLGLSDFTDFF